MEAIFELNNNLSKKNIFSLHRCQNNLKFIYLLFLKLMSLNVFDTYLLVSFYMISYSVLKKISNYIHAGYDPTKCN